MKKRQYGTYKVEIAGGDDGTGTFQLKLRVNNLCRLNDQDQPDYHWFGGPKGYNARETCEYCPLRWRCPVRLKRNIGVYVLKADLIKENIQRRRRAQASGEFAQRYAVRAGIEGTNSELKRAHGLGRLRVRGGPRVRLAVYLKALACNIKRMVRARLVEMEKTAQGLTETVPAVATP